jgi:hypothetical protein
VYSRVEKRREAAPAVVFGVENPYDPTRYWVWTMIGAPYVGVK